MAIPKFDKFGNIPVGDLFAKPGDPFPTPLIRTDLQTLHERFVREFTRSKTRQSIWDGWMNHRFDLEKLGLRYATLVGGSFTTTKGDPSDIDLCIIFEAAGVGGLDAHARAELGRLTRSSETKPGYKCDVYPLPLYPLSNYRFGSTARDWNYWTRVYGFDRSGHPKAVFLVI
jgi:hypothetical protein